MVDSVGTCARSSAAGWGMWCFAGDGVQATLTRAIFCRKQYVRSKEGPERIVGDEGNFDNTPTSVSIEHPGTARDLSWSWWLSRPVQQYLHEQTDPAERSRFDVENERPIDDLLHALADRTKRGVSTAACDVYGVSSLKHDK
jgi:hypothetical protein